MVTQLGSDDIMIKITQPSPPRKLNAVQFVVLSRCLWDPQVLWVAAKLAGRARPPGRHWSECRPEGRARQFCCNPEYRSAMGFCRKPPNRGLATCISWILDFTTWVGHNISSEPATVITTKFLYYRYDAMLWFLSYSLCHVGDSGARVKSWGHTKLSIIILSTLRIFFFGGGSGFSKLLKTRLLGTPVYLGQIRNFLRYPITWDVPCNWVTTV